MANGNLELIQRGYEAFGRADIPAVLEIMSDDVEMNVPAVLPQGMQARGKDEVGEFFQKLGSSWDDFGLEIDDFVASGDRVCVVGRAGGTTGGKQTSYGFAHVWTVRDGAAVKFDEYVDPSPELLA